MKKLLKNTKSIKNSLKELVMDKEMNPEERLIHGLKKYIYDNREWTTSGWNKAIDNQLKAQQRDLKFYFEQYKMWCPSKK